MRSIPGNSSPATAGNWRAAQQSKSEQSHSQSYVCTRCPFGSWHRRERQAHCSRATKCFLFRGLFIEKIKSLLISKAIIYQPQTSSISTQWIFFRPEFRVEHHGFCYASQEAYGAALYVRVEKGHTTMIHLLTAKTRVAPVKRVSLPRLELCGALPLSEMT